MFPNYIDLVGHKKKQQKKQKKGKKYTYKKDKLINK